MTTKSLVSLLLLLLVLATALADDGYRIQFAAKSAKSDIFAPLRANKQMVLISECNKQVTEPLGILEQEYEQASAKPNEKCSWRLHAPANHLVNVISILFVLEDEKPVDERGDDYKTSTISLYDGRATSDDRLLLLLQKYFVSPQEKVGQFLRSMSSGQDMTVEINYHEHKDFARQKMLINYEFLDADKVRELLREH